MLPGNANLPIGAPKLSYGSLFVGSPRTRRITAIAIAADMFRQPFSCDLGPHPGRILNGPAIFTIRLGLITATFQFGFGCSLVKILDRHREVSHIRLIFGMLALAKVESVLAEFE